jgi:hypothetical protein
MRGTFLVIGLLAAGLLPLSSGFAQENDYLIVPGQRVGRWELGKPVGTYQFGQQGSRWDGTSGGTVYYEGYAFPQRTQAPYLQVYACKNDALVFAILVVRRLNLDLQPDAEEFKYRTAEGVRIGMDESEVVRILGQPEGSGQFNERHGQIEIVIRQHEYRDKGLFVRVNRGDLKVLALGAMRAGGFQACLQAVRGSPATAQQPAASPRPATAGVPVNVQLPVPLPADLQIIPPGADVPAGHAAFSGVWSGRWEGTLDTALVVQQIAQPEVSTVYAWGVAPSWNIHRAGWLRARARFVGSELHVQTNVLIVYRMSPDGRLDGEFRGTGLPPTRGTLMKVFPR